ncbi:GntR family transcriptional regulator [Microvirga antarctica]|uniref:GntR family transcriptional regulator n=1 Tax=Microvirga antarctica TaxID=2819233 RepID=UPI001B316F5C|nr:GntR family transcriptional regulator [Microvirga antarctica]
MSVQTLRRDDDGVDSETDSLAEIAYTRIEDLIVTMELKPGSRVSEPFLVTRLGLGRTPIREALLRLAMDQLLVWMPRRGMLVRDINLQTQLKVLETRRALEMLMVPSAARRRTPEEAEILREIVGRFRALRGGPDHVPLLRLDREFIGRLVQISRNPFLRSIMPLYALSRRFWLACEGYQTRFKPDEITDFHIRIGEAVAAGDEPAATALTAEFLDLVEAFTRYAGTEFF